MKFSEEFRDQELVQEAARRLGRLAGAPATIMEVCGTHTMNVARFGLKSLLPPGVRLVSGPGCPVCVTDQSDIDAFLALGDIPGAVLASFGDMLRVPGSAASLERRRAEGTAVRLVYSPLDAVALARQHPGRSVIFFAVGFETTMPATALAVQTAAQESLENFSVFCVHKTMPPALQALLAGGEVRVAGLLLPGHVAAVAGAAAFDFIPAHFHLPCAVAGFEPLDILLGLEAILRRLQTGTPGVDNAYRRAVPAAANPRAQSLLKEVFATADVAWRGLGVIHGSGVKLRERYATFDAAGRFREIIAATEPAPPTACRCGEVLRGVMAPAECPLFGRTCTPEEPAGPCMVSGEGACAAVYRYETPASPSA